jgi:hypothetical protein
MIAITTRMTTRTWKLGNIVKVFSEALDAFAIYRARRAVPEYELRRVQREINRYRKIISESTAR